MKKFLTFAALLVFFVTFSQTTYTNKAFGFTITLPNGWTKASFNESDIKIENNGESLIKGKYDYNIADFGKTISRDYKAVNSRITVDVWKNEQQDNFNELKKIVAWSVENNIKPELDNFSIKQELSEITISGIKSLYIIFQYDFLMPEPNGGIVKVRNRLYVIPYKGYFFRIMCIDGQEPEYDASKDFEEIIAGIKIEN